MKLLNNVDLQNGQANNLRLHFAASPPTAALEGMLYYDTVNHRPRWKDASAWQDVYPLASANTANTGVLRDASGNFNAGTITAALSGNASTATALQNSRNFSITGKATASSIGFNGTGDVALNVTALSVACSDIALTSGYLIVGNGSNVGAATAKSAIALSGFGAATASVDLGNQKIINLANPTADTDAATKGYVDSLAMGFDVKASVRVATSGALPAHTFTAGTNTMTATANGAIPAIDGVTLAGGDRILVKDESASLENGIYVLNQAGDGTHPWILQRGTDSDSSSFDAWNRSEVSSGMYCWVEEGTVNGDSGWILTTNNPITLNTTALTFQQFSGTGQITMGNGLVKVGNTIHFAQSAAYTANKIPFAGSTTTISFTSNAPTTARRVLICASGGSPDWSTVALGDTDYVSGTLLAGNGGTGIASYTAGDLLYASGTTALAKLAIGTVGKILRSSGSAPTWTTSTFPDTATQYDLLYASAANTWSSLAKAANTGALVSSSTGVLSWTTTTTNWNVLRRDGSGNITFGTLDISQAGGVTGLLAMANGGTGANLTGSAGGIVWTSGATTMAVLSGTGTANKMLLSGASATPTWSTSTHPTAAGAAGTFVRSDGTNYVNSNLILPDSAAAGQIPYGSASNTVSMLAAGTSGYVLQCGGAGAPNWLNLFGTTNTWTTAQYVTRAVASDTVHDGWILESDAAISGAQSKFSPSITFIGHYWNGSADATQTSRIYQDPKANSAGGGTGGMTMSRPLVIEYSGADLVGFFTSSGSAYIHLIPPTASTGKAYFMSAQDVRLQAGAGGGAHVNGYDAYITPGNSDASAGSLGGNVYLEVGTGDVAANNGRIDISASAKSVRFNHLTASRSVRLDANKDLVVCGYDMPAAVTTVGRFMIVTSTTSVVESSYAIPTGTLTAGQVWVNASTTQVTPVTLAANTIVGGNGASGLTTYAGTADQVMRCSGTTPGFGSINLAAAAAVGTSILAAANGGTNNAFFQVSGPAASVKTFTFPNASSTIPRILGSTITGDGTSTTRTVTHNFGTRDLQVQVFETSGSYDAVYPDIELTDTNTVTIRFLTAPANGYTYRVVIVSM